MGKIRKSENIYSLSGNSLDPNDQKSAESWKREESVTLLYDQGKSQTVMCAEKM